MEQFINHAMLAPNVVTAGVDAAIVREFAALAAAKRDESDFATVDPTWSSDLKWISANRPETFALFERAFERLDVARHVAQYLGVDEQARLFAGFLLIRTRCEAPHFHVDWSVSNNQAFTCITPVTDNAADFGLLYHKLTGETGEYRYEVGEAIIFGDHFSHSTKPGRSHAPVVLLCFQFGTDRMADWPPILASADTQSKLIRQPDGSFLRIGEAASERSIRR